MDDDEKYSSYFRAARKSFVDYFDEAFPDFRCEVCGTQDWGVNTSLATPTFVKYDGDDAVYAHDVTHPCFVLHCTTCGNSKFFSVHLIADKLDITAEGFDVDVNNVTEGEEA